MKPLANSNLISYSMISEQTYPIKASQRPWLPTSGSRDSRYNIFLTHDVVEYTKLIPSLFALSTRDISEYYHS